MFWSSPTALGTPTGILLFLLVISSSATFFCSGILLGEFDAPFHPLPFFCVDGRPFCIYSRFFPTDSTPFEALFLLRSWTARRFSLLTFVFLVPRPFFLDGVYYFAPLSTLSLSPRLVTFLSRRSKREGLSHFVRPFVIPAQGESFPVFFLQPRKDIETVLLANTNDPFTMQFPGNIFSPYFPSLLIIPLRILEFHLYSNFPDFFSKPLVFSPFRHDCQVIYSHSFFFSQAFFGGTPLIDQSRVSFLILRGSPSLVARHSFVFF